MLAFALPVDDVLNPLVQSDLVVAGQGNAPGGVTITGAGTTDDHLVNGIVVFLVNLRSKVGSRGEERGDTVPVVEHLVSQGVQLIQDDSDIRDLRQIGDLVGIRVVCRDVRGDGFEDQLKRAN